MKIIKFGGTSVGMPHRMHQVAKIINTTPGKKIVVLSALSGTTNALVEIGKYLTNHQPKEAIFIVDTLEDHYNAFVTDLLKKEQTIGLARQTITSHFSFIRGLADGSFSEQLNKELLAQGELISTRLFYIYLQEIKTDAKLIPALDFMVIDVDKEPIIPQIKENWQVLVRGVQSDTMITQGFICRNHLGEIDNLKRGGSDYSASLIGAAIGSDEIQIWTDIDGMHNNDPRVVKNTFPIEALSFDEAAELAYFGAKILHPSSIWPAQKFNVPVRLKNTMMPDAKGTLITAEELDKGIKAIAAKEGITAIKIKSSRMLLAHGFLRRIFEIFEKYKTSIDMITTSEVAVSVTIDDQTYLDQIKQELDALGFVEVDSDMTIVCIVGSFVSEKKGVINKVINALKEIPIRMISYGGSRHNISVLIPSSYKNEALQLLNDGLFAELRANVDHQEPVN